MKWLALIVKFLPAVLAGVTGVEAALSGAPGTTKKQIVLNIIHAGAEAAGQAPSADVQAVGSLIDTVVGVLNTSGVFTKATPTK